MGEGIWFAGINSRRLDLGETIVATENLELAS
jgi:hypothetical protein